MEIISSEVNRLVKITDHDTTQSVLDLHEKSSN